MRPARERVVIIGGGGHARVVVDILRQQGVYDIVGCLDRAEHAGRLVSGVRIIGGDDMLAAVLAEGVGNAFVALGDNRRRAELASRARDLGFRLINAVSAGAWLSAGASLADGIAAMPGAVVNAGSVVGRDVIVNTNASVDHDCVLGAGCHIGPGCALAGNVRVGEGAFLGTGARVIPGVRVGRRSVIGAGAVLIGDVPDDCLAVGVPARVVKSGSGRE